MSSTSNLVVAHSATHQEWSRVRVKREAVDSMRREAVVASLMSRADVPELTASLTYIISSRDGAASRHGVRCRLPSLSP